MKLGDIYWIAGLLEGEGSFDFNGTTIRICLAMTDEDVVKRAGQILGVRKIRARQRYHWKVSYETQIAGTNAAQWMMTILPLMGSRRAETIRQCLGKWRFRPSLFSYGQEHGSFCKCLEEGRKCQSCRQRSYRERVKLGTVRKRKVKETI